MIENPVKKERVKLWRRRELGAVDLLRATYVTQTFPRHCHDGFAVGVIERGALGFYYRGENVVAPAGAVNLANPGEAHTGQAATGDGWTYRMFYLGLDELKKAASDISGRGQDIPFFPTGVIHDDGLATLIRTLHVNLEADGALLLALQANFLKMLATLITRHADTPLPVRPAGTERRRIQMVCEFLRAHCNENISLPQAASIACLSPYHFLNVFKKTTGLTPHAYLIQLRVSNARTLLERGWTVAAAAAEAGFADQSHLTRHFKRITGMTPGYFSKIVQDH